MKIQAQNRGPQINKRLSRFETLNMKIDRSQVISKKNEVLRFMLEMAGNGLQVTHEDQAQNKNQESITKALMSAMVQSN